MNKNPYQLFFDFYNHHYDHELKNLFVSLIEETMKKDNLIECGCGPAHVSIALRKKGIDIVASDISDDFLTIAKANAKKANVALNTLHHDILTPLKRQYDGVVMVFDVINHLETLNDFDRAIFHLYQCLKEDGVLIIDSLRCDYIEKMISYEETLTNETDTLHWSISKGPYPCSFRHRLRRDQKVSTLNQRSFDLKTMQSLFARFKTLKTIHLEDRDIFVLKK